MARPLHFRSRPSACEDAAEATAELRASAPWDSEGRPLCRRGLIRNLAGEVRTELTTSGPHLETSCGSVAVAVRRSGGQQRDEVAGTKFGHPRTDRAPNITPGRDLERELLLPTGAYVRAESASSQIDHSLKRSEILTGRA